MADEPEPDRMAKYKLLLPHNPAKSDVMYLTVDFLDIKISMRWSHHNQHEVIHLLKTFAEPLMKKCGLDFEQALAATQIDGDLAALFPEDETP